MPSVFNRPELKVLAKKVKVELHPRTSEVLTKAIKTGIGRPFILNVVVEITARGEKFTAEEVAPKGDPTNPVTEDEILAKFRNNASFSMLPSSRVELVIKMISQLEKVDDITELTKLLTTG
jgi:2-methylcitrate dehydratase PrpD